MIELDAVTKRYDDFLLDGVNLRVPDRALTVLLGPSGSGKSTLLRLMTGLETPDVGRVLLAGKDITRTPVEARGMGLVFQDGALFPHLDVAHNVGFGVPKHERAARVEVALVLVGLAGFGARRVDKLSGGERQRVALARALAPRPRVLLLDEPLASLDRNLREDLRRALRAIHDTLGLTTVVVTHDREEALALADRIALVREGKVVEEGAARDVFERPKSAFAAKFLGSANLIDGKLVRVDRTRFAPDPFGDAVIEEIRFAGFHDEARARRDDGTILDARGPVGSFPPKAARVRVRVDEQ